MLLHVLPLVIGLIAVPSWSFPERTQLTAELKEPKLENVDYHREIGPNEKETHNVKSLEPELQARVSYAGSQLWKVVVDDNEKKRVIAQLRDEKGNIQKRSVIIFLIKTL